MKKYSKYLLWFVPTISFAIFFIGSGSLSFYIVKLTDKIDWILALPIIFYF